MKNSNKPSNPNPQSIETGDFKNTIGAAVGDHASSNVKIYGDIYTYPIRLKTTLRNNFSGLIEEHMKIFGGRSEELDFILNFIRQPQSGILAITALPGFGKTTLLANLIGRTPEAFAFHFFTSLYYESSLKEEIFLQNVLEQIKVWHNKKEELPDKIEELRALYNDLIDEPLESKQILVLDGLDEVRQWNLAFYLRRKIPDNLKIIVSISNTGQDWRSEYKFDSKQLKELPMGGINRDGLSKMLLASGTEGEAIAKDKEKLNKLVAIAAYESDPTIGSDPFYVRVLIEDIGEKKITSENIESVPVGLDDYLKEWWQQIEELVGKGDNNIQDLFGTLAVAKGYIQRSDLEVMYPGLKKNFGGVFNKILMEVRRFVIGNERSGYALAHPRLKRYMIGVIDSKTYQEDLIIYCSKWKETKSNYALNYFITHLADANRIDEMKNVFSAEWFAAKWLQVSSYQSLIQDFSIAIQKLASQNEPDYISIFSFNIARQTAQDYLIELPEKYYPTLIRLGEIDKAYSALSKMDSDRGLASEPMIAASEELLNRYAGATNNSEKASLLEKAELLLLRSTLMIPSLRFSVDRIKACENVLTLIENSPSISKSTKDEILNEIESFARESLSEDSVLSADIFGLLSSTQLHSANNPDKAASLSTETIKIAKNIKSPSDRVEIYSFCLPALFNLDPKKSFELLKKCISNTKALVKSSLHFPLPYILLTKKISLEQQVDFLKAVTPSLISDCSLGNLRSLPNDLYFTCIRQCFDLGKIKEAEILLNTIEKHDPKFACLCAFSCADVINDFSRVKLLHWLKKGEELLTKKSLSDDDSADLAAAVIVTYSLTDAKYSGNSFSEVNMEDKLPHFLSQVIGFVLPTDLRSEVINRSIPLIDQCNPDKQYDLLVDYALQIAATDPEKARGLLGRAIALKLKELPEGEPDNLKELCAMVLHLENNFEAAINSIKSMKWIISKTEALSYLISDASQNNSTLLNAYVEYLIVLIRNGKDESLFSDSLIHAAQSLNDIFEASPELAAQLADLVMKCLDTLKTISNRIKTSSLLSLAYAKTSPENSYNLFCHFSGWMKTVQSKGYKINGFDVLFFCNRFYEASKHFHNTIAPVIDDIEAILANAEKRDKFDILCGLFQLYSLEDPASSQVHFNKLIEYVEEDDDKNDLTDIALVNKTFTDLTGSEWHGPAKIIGTITKTLAIHSRVNSPNSVKLLNNLFKSTLDIKDARARAKGIIELFDSCKEFQLNGNSTEWKEFLTLSLQNALKSIELAYHSQIWQSAVSSLIETGCIDTVQLLLEKVNDSTVREEIEARINIQQIKDNIGNLSPFEKLAIKLADNDLAIQCVYSAREVKKTLEYLNDFTDSIAKNQVLYSRLDLIDTVMTAIAPLIYAHKGRQGIQELITQIETLDNNFLKAADLMTV